jgi:hypothetical protein
VPQQDSVAYCVASDAVDWLTADFSLGRNLSVTELFQKLTAAGLNPHPKKTAPPIAFAWGVLGSAIGGIFLLTHPVVFRSVCLNLTRVREKVSPLFKNFENF